MSKSKKGFAFEREISRLLSLWWSEGKQDDVFYRTTASGARATVRRKQGKTTADSAGDIMAMDEKGKPFTGACILEVKRGYSSKYKITKNKKTKKLGVKQTAYGLEVLSILDKQERSKEPILGMWWYKLEKERMDAKRKFAFLIFRRDAKLACISMYKNTYQLLRKRNGPFKYRQIDIAFNPSHTLSILKLEDFFSWVRPESFLKLPRKIKRRPR